MALNRRTLRIGMTVQYKAWKVRFWLRGTVHGVMYADNPMKRANISHVVVKSDYGNGKEFNASHYTVVPIEDVRAPR